MKKGHALKWRYQGAVLEFMVLDCKLERMHGFINLYEEVMCVLPFNDHRSV